MFSQYAEETQYLSIFAKVEYLTYCVMKVLQFETLANGTCVAEFEFIAKNYRIHIELENWGCVTLLRKDVLEDAENFAPIQTLKGDCFDFDLSFSSPLFIRIVCDNQAHGFYKSLV